MDWKELQDLLYKLKREREADPHYDPNVIEFWFFGTPEEREAVQAKMNDLFKKYLAEHDVSGASHPASQ